MYTTVTIYVRVFSCTCTYMYMYNNMYMYMRYFPVCGEVWSECHYDVTSSYCTSSLTHSVVTVCY